MIAKLIAHGRDRDEALDRLAAALAETEIEGVTTNLPFLRWLVAHPVVRAGEATTAFLVENPPLSPPRSSSRPRPGASPGGSTPAPSSPLAAGRRLRRARGQAQGRRRRDRDRADAGDGRPRRGRARRSRRGAPIARGAGGDEDGDPVHSPFEGTVKAVHVGAGDRVAGGAVLVELES